MKRKISLSMCCIAAISVIITAIMISALLYNRNYNKLKSNIENEAEVTEDMQILQEGLALLGIDYLGGHGSRGYGRVNISIDDVKPVGNSAINTQDLLDILRK